VTAALGGFIFVDDCGMIWWAGLPGCFFLDEFSLLYGLQKARSFV